jgi:predicted amidohydrolase
MRIGVAQTRSFKGDILRNIESHIRLIELAAAVQADTIIFPELSLTGYEPELASGLAGRVEDERLDIFQALSDGYSMTIGVGFPTRAGSGVRITMLIFQPGQVRQAYSKRYLHADEEPFFVCGTEAVYLENRKVALAICYELSVPAHAEQAHHSGAEIYLVSVAKTRSGMEKAAEALTDIARRYSMTVLISNSIGPCDNFECSGGSAVWDTQGAMKAQLSETEEGILVLDTETGMVTKNKRTGTKYESQ